MNQQISKTYTAPQAVMVAALLVQESRWFSIDPLPNDLYEIFVKREAAKHLPDPSTASVQVPTAVVEINGGLVNAVRSNVPMRVIVLDEDVEGASEETISEIGGEEAVVYDFELAEPAEPGFSGVDTDFVAEVRSQVDVEKDLPLFEVSFEDVGFTNSKLVSTARLSAQKAKRLTAELTAKGALPEGVVAVVKGYAEPDEEQGKRDVKVFSNVTLLIQAASEADANLFEPPAELLNQVSDLMTTVRKCGPLPLEGNWELVEVEGSA